MKFLATSLLACALGSPALAQAVNVDFSPTFGTPSGLLGAAAAQPGAWNTLVVAAGTSAPLTAAGGGATAVTVTQNAGVFNFAFNNAGTLGDDEALMDDFVDTGAPPATTFTFNGVAAGSYSVYTYAWAADSATFISSVTVAGAVEGAQNVGGAWPGGYTAGITHALHTVTVGGAGTITITLTTVAGFDSLNGVQIKPLSIYSSFCSQNVGGICPCANNPPGPNMGCLNSSGVGAVITAAGNPNLVADATDPGSVTLTGTNMFNGNTCIFLQGDATVGALPFFSGARCVGGNLIRLYVKSGVSPTGTMTAPTGTDLSISNRSATAVPPQPISPGNSRHYMIYYRDTIPVGACLPNQAANSTNAITIIWS